MDICVKASNGFFTFFLGTPLQLQAMNRVKNSELSRPAKSLSDSIKKHIFHKGIMSRTPKRQPVPEVITLVSLKTLNIKFI